MLHPTIFSPGAFFPVPAPVLLFDLDGTLIHSIPDLTVAANACLADDGHPPVNEEAMSQMVGNGIRILVQRVYASVGAPLTTEAAVDELFVRFNAHYMKAPTALTRPFPGVVETLDRLHLAGCPLAVVTNKPIEPAEAILDQLELRKYFGAVIGGGSVPNLKPHPEPIEEALKRLNAGKRPVVMVGDSANDTEAARNANIPCVALTYGYRRCSLEELGADILIDHFSEVPAAVQKLLQKAEQLG